MQFYLAPLEGITGYIYRNAHAKHFKGIDKYFAPFIATNQYGSLSTKEKNDIDPLNNQNLYCIPQLLSNQADDFLNVANQLSEKGYDEINLNLGCPSDRTSVV